MYGLDKVAEELEANNSGFLPGDGTLRPDAETAKDDRSSDEPLQFSSSANEGALETAKETINRAFAKRREAASSDQSLMAKNFDHVASGQFTTHSPQLKPKSKVASYKPQTLSSQVRRLGLG